MCVWVFRESPCVFSCYRHTLVYNETNGQKDSTQIKCAVKVKEMDGYSWMRRELYVCVRESEKKEERSYPCMCVRVYCVRKKGKNTVGTVVDFMENVCMCVCDCVSGMYTRSHTIHQIDFSMYVNVLRHYRSFSCLLSCSLSTYQIFQALILQTHFTFTVMNHRTQVFTKHIVCFKIPKKNR